MTIARSTSTPVARKLQAALIQLAFASHKREREMYARAQEAPLPFSREISPPGRRTKTVFAAMHHISPRHGLENPGWQRAQGATARNIHALIACK